MDRSGRSVLAIEPLLWRDGWPVGGSNLAPGTYEIRSERSGNALQLKTDFVRIAFEQAGPLRFRTSYIAATREALDLYLNEHTAHFRADFLAHFPSGAVLAREIWSETEHWG